MSGLFHISDEDLESLEQHGLIHNYDRGIGPLGGHTDDEDWFSTVQSMSEENDRLNKENKRLKKELAELKRKKSKR